MSSILCSTVTPKRNWAKSKFFPLRISFFFSMNLIRSNLKQFIWQTVRHECKYQYKVNVNRQIHVAQKLAKDSLEDKNPARARYIWNAPQNSFNRIVLLNTFGGNETEITSSLIYAANYFWTAISPLKIENAKNHNFLKGERILFQFSEKRPISCSTHANALLGTWVSFLLLSSENSIDNE